MFVRKNSLLVLLLLSSFLLLAKAETFKKPPHTLIFVQGQWHYTLNPWFNQRPYFSEWTDWPLFIDSKLLLKDDKKHVNMQYIEYAKIQENIKKYGLDGICFWEQHCRYGFVPDLIGHTRRSNLPDFKMIPFIDKAFAFKSDLKRIYDSPDILEFDGKKVFWSYWVDNDSTLDGYRKKIEEKHPGKFLFIRNKKIPDAFLYSTKKRDFIAEDDRELLKTEVRESLRLFDGFGWWDFCQLNKDSGGRRVFRTEFLRELLTLTKEVFSEPEFTGKLFVSEALVGHENSSWIGYMLSSEGTKTLRDSLSVALEAGVDIINIPEWDEQCENTSLRPTVYNGTAHMRVMRYFTGFLRGQESNMLPGDNPEIPNLILSMRKIITLGEKLDFELLHIPDQAKDNSQYRVKLRLRNLQNEIVHQFDWLNIQSNKFVEHRPAVASEKFASERVLFPELIVEKDDKEQVFADGLSVVQIQPTWNFDYKWVKQPLRDLMEKPDIQFKITPSDDKNIMQVTASVEAPESLNFIELLDNGDCIYSATQEDKKNLWRENSEELVFRVYMESIVHQQVTGTIKLQGTDPKWKGTDKKHLTYENSPADFWHRGGWVRMPRQDLEKAYFEIDFPGHYNGNIPVKEIVDKHCVIVGGRKGFNVAINRQLRQFIHPENLDSKKSTFTTTFAPDLAMSVMQLQLISENAQLWRSRPLLAGQLSKENKTVIVYSETENKPVTVQVPSNLVPDLQYDCTQKKSLVVPVAEGRTLWGVRGGYIDLATLRVGGYLNSDCGTPPTSRLVNAFWGDSGDLAPSIETLDDGKTVLHFSGNGEHVAFPVGAIPRRTGFTIKLQIKPENINKKQYVLSNRRDMPGLLTHVFIQDGTLQGIITNDKFNQHTFNTDIQLKEKDWNEIKITYDQSHIQFVVNGVASERYFAPGPGPYDMPLLLGTWNKDSFKGWIAEFSITHSF